jgi:hypothetical protein
VLSWVLSWVVAPPTTRSDAVGIIIGIAAANRNMLN